MKKIIAFILVLAVCLSLAACGAKPVQSNIENVHDKSNVELTIEAVNGLLASKEYVEKKSKFEELTGSESSNPKVSFAMEYKLDGFDGFDLHLLLINLELDYAANNSFYDRMTFKTHFITDINSTEIDRKKMRFRCDCCGKPAKQMVFWGKAY